MKKPCDATDFKHIQNIGHNTSSSYCAAPVCTHPVKLISLIFHLVPDIIGCLCTGGHQALDRTYVMCFDGRKMHTPHEQPDLASGSGSQQWTTHARVHHIRRMHRMQNDSCACVYWTLYKYAGARVCVCTTSVCVCVCTYMPNSKRGWWTCGQAVAQSRTAAQTVVGTGQNR